MISKVNSSSICGVDASKIQVEAICENNEKEKFVIIGLADSIVKESKERVTSALKSYGIILPKKIIINLAPADIPKEGSCLDLAIAISLMASKGMLSQEKLDNISFHGELSLDGEINSIKGTVALVIEAKKNNIKTVIVPIKNYQEAKLIKNINVVPVRNLQDVLNFINKGEVIDTSDLKNKGLLSSNLLSIDDVWGQEQAKKALIICASGGHNLLMIGSPGCGKSMLAKRMPSILPYLSESEILETVKIHSIANQPIKNIILGEAPFRSPHHNISEAGLIGGGSNPKPGEISLAHNGVLFLDEFPEFKRSALESLRAPMENHFVNISRSKMKVWLPANFKLLAAMNPCPCGFFLSKTTKCHCTNAQILNYINKLSGPIIDRIDLHVEMQEVELSNVKNFKSAQKSYVNIREKIIEVKNLQFQRQKKLNSDLTGEELISNKHIAQNSLRFLEDISFKLKISARSYVKILKVARTIADLEDAPLILDHHIASALEYRKLDNLRNHINRLVGNF